MPPSPPSLQRVTTVSRRLSTSPASFILSNCPVRLSQQPLLQISPGPGIEAQLKQPLLHSMGSARTDKLAVDTFLNGTHAPTVASSRCARFSDPAPGKRSQPPDPTMDAAVQAGSETFIIPRNVGHDSPLSVMAFISRKSLFLSGRRSA